ncbi:MAG: hypothetical protein R2698_00370 [Microthrixaceae bacterium]
MSGVGVVVVGAIDVARALASRPDLWRTALRQGVALVPRRWWAGAPRLPIPDAAYLRFRVVTAYGGDGSLPSEASRHLGRDAVAYLEWCKAEHVALRAR